MEIHDQITVYKGSLPRRVAKTCQPVGANFSRPVLIFGQSTRKNCAIMSNAHITCTIAHRVNSSQNCTTNTIVVSTGATT